MASCLVPDFPAVQVALGHLKELEKELRHGGHWFVPEASLHLSEVAAAVSELEAARRVVHEQLEVESIENSKLRHQILNIREEMSRVIMADVAAARESKAEEIQELSGDLKAVSLRQEDVTKRQEVLLRQNDVLGPERDEARARHDGEVAALNQHMDRKFDLQNELRKTREQVEELESRVADVRQRKLRAQEETILWRGALAERKEELCREMERIMEDVQQQMNVNNSSRKELDAVNVKKRGAQVRHGELTGQVAQLEGDARRLEAARSQCEEQLEEEIQECGRLEEQREKLEEELCELRRRFCSTERRLREEVAAEGGRIEEGQTARRLRLDSLAQVSQRFKSQQEEEEKEREEHTEVSGHSERSRVQLEEQVASIVTHCNETIEMEEQSRHLLRTDLLQRGHYDNLLRELKGLLDAERKSVAQAAVEKQRLSLQLEEARRKQGEHEAQISTDTDSTRRRYETLRREEVSLLQGRSIESLTSSMTRSEEVFRQKEEEHQQETQRCTAETEQVLMSSNEKQREAEEEEEALKEVEAEFKEEQRNLERLQTLTSELRSRQEELQERIQRVGEDTSALLRPGEQRKEELQAQRERHARLLRQQASQLRSIEVSVYQSDLKLQQVSRENSRLHLSNTHMKEDICRAQENQGRYQEEAQRLHQDTEVLVGELEAAWREEVRLIQHRQDADGLLLASMDLLLSRMMKRRRGLQEVNTLLHTHLLDFTKKMGGTHSSVCQQ